jgi:pimeloyl-ACP methyl ester carboxylesterase
MIRNILGFVIIAALLAGPVFAESRPPSFKVEVIGRGQPMILIPGLSASPETWDATVEHYRNTFECHLLTLAGFVGMPRIAGPLLETVATDLVAYVRERKLERPIIVGHSLGGFLALKLASYEPELFGKIVVVDALPFFAGASNPKITLEAARQMADQMRAQMIAASAKGSYDPTPFVSTMATKPEDIARLVKWSRESDGTAVADALHELFSSDLRDSIGAIKIPSLVLGSWIAYKQYATREQIENNFRRQYTGLKGYKFALFDNARHFLMWDDPASFFRELDDFLGAGAVR